MAKAANYTPEMETEMTAMYVAGQAANLSNKDNVAAIAEKLSRVSRSVTSKLSRMGVYVTEEKVKAQPRDDGPTKTALLSALENLVGIDLESGMGMNKADIVTLTAAVSGLISTETVDADDSGEVA